MKNYIKILLITLSIQLGGIVAGALLSNLGSVSDRLGDTIFLGCVPIAIIVDIILAYCSVVRHIGKYLQVINFLETILPQDM